MGIFPYDYVYFKAFYENTENPLFTEDFHTITSILKHKLIWEIILYYAVFPYDYVYFKAGGSYAPPTSLGCLNFHTITSILKQYRSSKRPQTTEAGFPYDYVYFKAFGSSRLLWRIV